MIHVAGKVDPIADIEVIETELALADLQTAEKALQRHQKTARSGDKESQRIVAVLEKCVAQLNEAKPIRALDLTTEERPTSPSSASSPPSARCTWATWPTMVSPITRCWTA